MTYEAYTWMCYIGAGLSVLMIIISVILFFKLKIIKVVGDLTGSNAKKAIKGIEEKSSAAENAINNSVGINQSRGRITDRISKSGSLQKSGVSSDLRAETEKLRVTDENATTVLYENSVSNETTVLYENQQSNETTVLNTGHAADESDIVNNVAEFVIEQDITFVHSMETI